MKKKDRAARTMAFWEERAGLNRNGSASVPTISRPSSPTTSASRSPVLPGASSLSRDPKSPTRSRLSWRERRQERRRLGKKPRKPRLKKARRARVGMRPSAKIWEMAGSCVKCGRTLTNPNSQRHRVGTDCIKRYGSQARQITNPAFTAWTDRKARAEIEFIAQKVANEADFARRQVAYDKALAAWRDARRALTS